MNDKPAGEESQTPAPQPGKRPADQKQTPARIPLRPDYITKGRKPLGKKTRKKT